MSGYDLYEDVSDTDTEETYNEYQTKFHSITVSSLDRDWYNRTDETPYSFNIKLGSGLENSFSYINIEPKNVISIGVDKLLINNTKIGINYSNASVDMTQYPYLLVSLDNIDHITYGSNKNLDNAIGVMSPQIPLTTSSNTTNYVEFKNILGKTKEMYDNPMASLSRLDISIKTPLGANPNNINDVLNIKCITYQEATNDDLSTEYLVVQTSDYFYEEQYKSGDVIKFQNYLYRDTGTYFEATNFNNFINRETGHRIITTSTSDSDKFLKNRIYITTPNEASITTGNVVATIWFNDLKDKSLGNLTTANVVNDTSGKLINCNHQSHLTFKIGSREKIFHIDKELV